MNNLLFPLALSLPAWDYIVNQSQNLPLLQPESPVKNKKIKIKRVCKNKWTTKRRVNINQPHFKGTVVRYNPVVVR